MKTATLMLWLLSALVASRFAFYHTDPAARVLCGVAIPFAFLNAWLDRPKGGAR